MEAIKQKIKIVNYCIIGEKFDIYFIYFQYTPKLI